MLIRKTWDGPFVGNVKGWVILRNGEEPNNGRMVLKWGS